MKAEDIKVGMWVRDPGGDVCKTSRQSEIVRGWHVEYPDGRMHTWPSEQLEPWTPQVGEWVRLDTIDAVDHNGRRGKVGRVREVKYTNAVAEAQSEAIYRQWMESRHRAKEAAKVEFKPVAAPCGPVVMHANSTCLQCGGPAYLGLQFAECLAPKCERVEPEPEMLLQPMAKSRNGWSVEDGPLHEDIWIACGRGKEVRHPVREEAIRLWREEVARG